jgi:hypothetical protein
VTPVRRREVTEDGMTRVAAVVAAMAESSGTDAGERTSASLTDLIAKAAQVLESHASSTRSMRARGLAQRGKASESLSAMRDSGPAVARTFDVTR